MPIFNHVQIKVKDIEASRQFYDALMSILGHDIVLEVQGVVIGYGTSINDMFEIRQSSNTVPLSQSVHICFNAADKRKVDDFYRTALEQGARCNGRPGLRPEYAEHYYACFVFDPDGHNIEAVCTSL